MTADADRPGLEWSQKVHARRTRHEEEEYPARKGASSGASNMGAESENAPPSARRNGSAAHESLPLAHAVVEAEEPAAETVARVFLPCCCRRCTGVLSGVLVLRNTNRRVRWGTACWLLDNWLL